MAYSFRLIFLFLCICFFSLFSSSHARHHHKHSFKRHKHGHHSSTPPISLPPTPQHGPAAPPTSESTAIFYVRKFGAVGDGVSDDTDAFRQAWDAASTMLLAPRGYTFMIQSTIFTGPCQSGFVLQIEGSLVAPDGLDSWPKNISRHQWLVFYRVNELSLKGGGLIDGRGEDWWDLPCKPHRGVNGRTL